MKRKKPEKSVSEKKDSIRDRASFGGRVVAFVCPACFARHELPWEKSVRFAPKCDYCGVPLVMTEEW